MSTRNRYPKGHLYKRGGLWWVQWKCKGQSYSKSLDTSDKNEAQTRLVAKINQVKVAIDDGSFLAKFGRGDVLPETPDPANDILLSNAWSIYLKSVNRPDTGKSTLEQYAFQIQAFVDWMSENHPDIKTISAVTKIVAREFASYIAEDRAANTFNKYMNLLRLMFRILNDNLDIELNPWENIQRKKANTQSKRDFSKAEVELILSKAKKDLYTICLIGSQTGFRMGDCCLMEWRETDLTTRLIKRAPLKTKSRTGKVARMYVFDKLLEHLIELKKTAKGKYICPGMASLYLRDRGATVSRRVQAFFSKCGIELYREEADERKIIEVGFHSFRHHCCTLAEENNVPESVAKEVFGWGSPNMKKVYTHISDDYLIKSWKKMEDQIKAVAEPPKAITPNISDLSADDLAKVALSIQEELKRRQQAS